MDEWSVIRVSRQEQNKKLLSKITGCVWKCNIHICIYMTIISIGQEKIAVTNECVKDVQTL